MIDIGTIIKQKLKEQDKSVVWLANQLSCSRTNVYKIFDKRSIDTGDLLRISNILKFDFFEIYRKELLSYNTKEPRKNDCGTTIIEK